jgi:uncharacterized protein (TIGR03437 family)
MRFQFNRFLRSTLWAGVLALSVAPAARPATTFGKVVEIGGHASDIALDERRGVVYLANYTGNRIEVISTSDGVVKQSMTVPAQPASLALSPNGKYLVVVHYAAFEAPASSANGITIIDLENNSRVRLTSGPAPLGVAFGADGMALVMTANNLQLLNTATGAATALADFAALTPEKLPVDFATFPPNIIAASMATSGDGLSIFGIGQGGDASKVFYFSHNVNTRATRILGYTTAPDLGPRVASVSRDGSYLLIGWALINTRGTLLAQFSGDARGRFDIGSHAIDSSRGLIYAQMPEGKDTKDLGEPVLTLRDADNLAPRERLRLPEHLAGKSVLSRDGNVMYSISQSGLTILPVGQLSSMPRVVARQESLLFRGAFCDPKVTIQEIDLVDPSGGHTPFSLSTSNPGIRVSPDSGVTPARVRVSVDFSAFKNQKGTSTGTIDISSGAAVNIADPVKVLVNNREPDQRGTFFNVPGKLVDIVADPSRDRFYVLRQDKNQVLVFDGSSFAQVATLRTGNTPWSMAITSDWRYLIVGNDNSQIANLYDLDTLQQLRYIEFPIGHYPRSIAASGGAVLAASRVAGPDHTIDVINVMQGVANPLPSLGVYKNKVHVNTVLAASPSGGKILVAQADGNVLVYNATSDTFTASRKDFDKLSGAFGAASDDRFIVDNHILNSSLTNIGSLDASSGSTSGFAAIDGVGFLTASPAASSPGTIQRVELSRMAGVRMVRTSESPLLGDGTTDGIPFTRTIAPLANRRAIVSLTTSGFTALAWDYDASIAPPRLDRVVNAADFETAVAPGGLVSIFGSNLSPINMATRELPLPTALGDSCLTVNGTLVPVLFVSPQQVNAQLPVNVEGQATLVLRTPGGVSDDFRFTIRPTAPGVFRSGTAGPLTSIPTLVRADLGTLVTISNPVHADDNITIYLTGLGRTVPAVPAGVPAPSEPLAVAAVEPTLTLGNVSLPVFFAGLAPGQVGVYQINTKIPFRDIPTGFDVPLTITQGGSSTTIPVRVVK